MTMSMLAVPVPTGRSDGLHLSVVSILHCVRLMTRTWPSVASYWLFLFAGQGFDEKGYEFKVFKMEWEEETKLVEVESLGDRALFVGKRSSFSLSANQFPGCRGNSIYYLWTYHGDGTHPTVKLRVYNLEDGSDVFINDDAAPPYEDWKPFAWFALSLLP